VWIILVGSFYHEWIVGCADPETVAQEVMSSLRPTGRLGVSGADPLADLAELSRGGHSLLPS
jgi:hypothetical protein